MVDVDMGKVRNVEQALREQGFKPFEVELGGKGVGVLRKFDQSMIKEFENAVGPLANEVSAWEYWS